MSLFDYLKCEYPLPDPEVQNEDFQTKNMDAPFCEWYKIDKEGNLLYEEYDIEDKSDPNAEGAKRVRGIMTRVNKRWKKTDLTDTIHFYAIKDDKWYSYDVIIVNGKITKLEKASDHWEKEQLSEQL